MCVYFFDSKYLQLSKSSSVFVIYRYSPKFRQRQVHVFGMIKYCGTTGICKEKNRKIVKIKTVILIKSDVDPVFQSLGQKQL